MRVSRLEFQGFRRLAATATSLDGPLTAFVGFNEAGKTSILQALQWFSTGGVMSSIDYNRSRPPISDDTHVVKVYYELDDADRDTFAGIVMDDAPTSLVLYRNRDGERYRVLEPRPKRPRKLFAEAEQRLVNSTARLAHQFAQAANEEFEDPNDWAATLQEALASPDEEWSKEEVDALAELSAWLKSTPPGLKHPRDAKLADMLDGVHPIVSIDHPNELAWKLLSPRMPEFVLFQDADRLLETSYEIGPEQRASVHAAVNRLLSLAGVDLDTMWAHIQAGDSTKRETLLEHGNDRLRAVFDQAWNQSKVALPNRGCRT